MKRILDFLFERIFGTTYNLASFLYICLEGFFTNFPRGINLFINVSKKQIYFTGIQAIPITIYIGIFMGMVVVTQIASFITGIGDLSTITNIINIGLVRETIPLLMAIVTITRSGSAITSELNLMKINNEFLTLRSLGINYIYSLIFSRIASFIISLLCLTIIATFMSILSGGISLYLFTNIATEDFFNTFFYRISPFDLVLLLLKAMFFGLIISTICCFYGLVIKKSVTEIPQLTTKAVLKCFYYVFIINIFLDMLVVLWE
ncbi:MAG: ABC transporter permease [Proteobacteria bacterium]|nr:ABC transporter permease [Pseudomonadota bacterium]